MERVIGLVPFEIFQKMKKVKNEFGTPFSNQIRRALDIYLEKMRCD